MRPRWHRRSMHPRTRHPRTCIRPNRSRRRHTPECHAPRLRTRSPGLRPLHRPFHASRCCPRSPRTVLRPLQGAPTVRFDGLAFSSSRLSCLRPSPGYPGVVAVAGYRADVRAPNLEAAILWPTGRAIGSRPSILVKVFRRAGSGAAQGVAQRAWFTRGGRPAHESLHVPTLVDRRCSGLSSSSSRAERCASAWRSTRRPAARARCRTDRSRRRPDAHGARASVVGSRPLWPGPLPTRKPRARSVGVWASPACVRGVSTEA